MYRIAIIRSASSAVSKSQYNIQEIGLAKELAKLGMLVDVFLISDKDETYKETLDLEKRVTVYWLKGIEIPGQQGYYKDLIPILNGAKYDLIQALDDSQITTVLVSHYCNKKGIKFVLWQGMYENYQETYKRAIQYVYDWTLLKELRKNTMYCIAKTSAAKKYLLGKNFSNIKVIPVGLEIGNFTSGNRINFREKLGIPDSCKILLYVGKVEKRRKPFFCVDLYERVKKSNDNCCLVYVGKGPLLGKIKSYVEEKGINGVHFIESIPQKDLPSLYADSDMFILPTRYEIFGMVLMESMYFGTPVITYKAAGPKDVIDDGKDGIIMDDFDLDMWSKRIEHHVFLRQDNKMMGELGKEKISSTFMWPKVARNYFDYYMQILNEQC